MKSKENPKLSHKKIDFGERRISKMNFSHIVTIPKFFIQSTPYEKITVVRITMSEDGCLKLTPVRAMNGDYEVDLSNP
ncbi:MAG: hypothetical protein EB150_00635 [Nitrososphaeria archaeon]|nr:hypothetical protein [Nitrososphaeria archaeon]NDB88658.1 hypothetical protein [Nitrososphaerota archaeon]NDF26287.1 hypothetical protein [Nitrosopumilaceae archaeon]NDB90170.1 hypothetical protein [Nitrososphaerota archaeon]NDB92106.1 hypothetical protein [Nitrososphaeria archaeon]